MRHKIRLAVNGPAILEGDIEIVGADGHSRCGDRFALCRCGQSQRKPFCDGNHKACSFVDAGEVGNGKVIDAPEGVGHLRATVKPNGSIRVEGPFHLENAAGVLKLESGAVSLCRCGQSQNRPFCDGAHKSCGFEDPGLLAG